MPDPIGREEFTATMDSLRNEFAAGLTTAGVQVGAVEKSLKSDLKSLKAWGVAALIGGQTLAGALAAYAPRQTAHAATVALHFLT